MRRVITAALLTTLAASGAGIATESGAGPTLVRSATLTAAELERLDGLLSEKRYHKATIAYQDLLTQGLPPNQALHARSQLARSMAAIGMPQLAGILWQDALRQAPPGPASSPLVAEWVDLALSQGDWRQILDRIDDIPTQSDPVGHDALRLLRGIRALDQGRLPAALVAFEDATASAALARRAHLLSATVYMRQGERADARAELERVLAVAGEPSEDDEAVVQLAQLNLARLAYAASDVAAAVAGYQRLLEEQPGSPALLRELAWAQARGGRPDLAWATLEQLHGKPCWPPDTALLAALLYLQTGQREVALGKVEAARRGLKEGSDALKLWLSAHPPSSADQLARELLHFGALPSDPVLEVGTGAAPPAELIQLLRDREPIVGYRARYEAMARDRARLERQPQWWRESPLGVALLGQLDAEALKVRGLAGEALLEQLGVEQRELGRILVQSYVAFQEKPAGQIPAWGGAPLPAP